MRSLRPTAVWLARMAAALVVGLMTAPAVFAAPPPKGATQDYVTAYGLTILACALGLTIVGRSSHRTTEVKFVDEE